MKSGKETSVVEAKRKKNVNYDKRLIKKVVEAVEADVPRSELCSLYGMNIKTLTL